MNRDIKILYAEDDVEIRNELLELLELDFSDIFVASNGEEGLALFEQHHPDIIITDIQMPKLDGITMCLQIHDQWHGVPTILTTAFNEAHYRKQAEAMHETYFLSKPINMKDFYAAIEECVKEVNKKRGDIKDL